MAHNKSHIQWRQEFERQALELDLEPLPLLILLAIISRSNAKAMANPSMQTIFNDCLCLKAAGGHLGGTPVSLRSVERWISKMRSVGIIYIKRRWKKHDPATGRKQRDSNIYKLAFLTQTEKMMKWQREKKDKSELTWETVSTGITGGSTRQLGGGKDNYKNKYIVIPDTRPQQKKSIPSGGLAAYLNPGVSPGGLFSQLDFFKQHGLLEIEVGAHDSSTDSIARRKLYWLSAERPKIGKWVAAAGHQGLGCFIRPASEPRHRFLLLDDLDACAVKQAARMDLDGLVVETSSGNYQVWLVSKKELTPAARHVEQLRLIELIGGDAGASAGTQFGRAAGTINTKNGRNSFLTSCQPLSTFNPSTIITKNTLAVIDHPKPALKRNLSEPVADNLGTDGSSIDFGITIGYIKKGVQDAQIINELSARRAARKPLRKPNDANRYAQKTLESAKRAMFK